MKHEFPFDTLKCYFCGETFKHPQHLQQHLLIEYTKRFRQKHPKRLRQYSKEWKNKNPKKFKAQKLGRKIPLGSECEFCGSKRNLERHHPDYDFPHIFVSCCDSCHKWVHKN